MKLNLSRVFWAVSAFGGVVGGIHTAEAREARADCSPEDWFCESDDGGVPELAPQPELPPDEPEQAPPSPPASGPAPSAAPPAAGMLATGQMDLSSDAPEEAGLSSAGSRSSWSASLRLQGVALGSAHDHSSGLGGLGVSLRYFLIPSFALDLGLDSFGGTDYNGHDRSEGALSLSSLLYLNPERPIRTYVLLGFDVSRASVDVNGDEQVWNYAGAHAGLGLEFLLGSHVSLGADMLGFLRGRTDSRAAREPEFSDGLGNLTNLSGGCLFRGAVSLYW